MGFFGDGNVSTIYVDMARGDNRENKWGGGLDPKNATSFFDFDFF